jgi:hypothetical protein
MRHFPMSHLSDGSSPYFNHVPKKVSHGVMSQADPALIDRGAGNFNHYTRVTSAMHLLYYYQYMRIYCTNDVL